MPAIPYAPEISPPYDMTPEQLAEWLRRLASQGQNAGQGGGAFGGKAMSPAGTSYEQYDVAPPEKPVVDPRLVQKFMQFQQQTQDPLSGSYNRNLENPEANPASFNAPTTSEELNFQRPPTQYDLPSDVAMREQFKVADESRSRQFKEETEAQAALESAKADRVRAEAAAITAGVYKDNPSLLAKNPFVASELLGAGRGGGGIPVPAPVTGVAEPTIVEPGMEDQNIETPAMPNFSRMAENAQIGKAFGPQVTPQKEIPQNYRPKRGGDIGAFYRSGNQIWVWDGQSYQRYQ